MPVSEHIMKKIYYILLILIFVASQKLFSVDFRNDKSKGMINNIGTITFRKPDTKIGMPDTVGGWVEYISDDPAHRQVIPNVTYNNLKLVGKTHKYIDSLWQSPSYNPLRTLDSIVVVNGVLVFLDSAEVHAKGPVVNTGRMVGKRDVKMNGDAAQTVTGNKGEFYNLNLDNYFGADVWKAVVSLFRESWSLPAVNCVTMLTITLLWWILRK